MARSCRNSVFVIDTTKYKCKILIWAIIININYRFQKFSFIWNMSVKFNWNVKAIGISQSFLVAFGKLRNKTVSFVPSVRLSVRIEQLGSHWTDFREIWCLFVCRKPIEKIPVWRKSDKNNGHLKTCKFMIKCRRIRFRMRNVANKCCRENQNTSFMFGNVFPKAVPYVR